ncbi:sulfite reductase subunit alpha [Mitsuaria sp. GD03876]|uniref:sulfite reductase subunit alpha n=1 Tax=Mitsuaria sp. GD03876 TaxID=2975399 RepID=UPI00244AF755|nr:sulfite reductase subunit alpha [Mitsuaria sp. GD03876]MDH0865499.1 sulfite reductase subunit alpha [Mitsuaria sp. GD03876]
MSVVLSRPATALLLVALYLLMCAAVAWRHRRRLRQAAEESAALLPAADAGPPVLVLHASQTGLAEELAWQTAKALHLAGMPVRVAALGEVDRDALLGARHALIIASTYGEGDAPDSAAPFARDLMAAAEGEALDLSSLQVGVLALGDATYTHFCGFGRALDAWLRERGARPMFDRIEADRADAQALAQWRQRLSHFAGTADLAEWEAPVFAPWRLRARRHLNPGSQGGPVFHLELVPADGSPLPAWEAGDLVQVSLAGDEGGDDAHRPREYTIASLPADGSVALMVRRTAREDGSPGLASGLLTERLPLDGTVALRLRPHASFRIGANADRKLILVGNGTGLAGLRAHLKARAAAHVAAHAAVTGGAAPAWLLFGERQSAHDAHYRDEIEAWQRDGVIAQADWAFSRDQAERVHVQHLLARHATRLRAWIADGAALYVCGSLQGMAGAVDEVLRETLGDADVDALIRDGRYRRDVY